MNRIPIPSHPLLERRSDTLDPLWYDYLAALGEFLDQPPQTYTATNVINVRAFDANATTVEELADVLGTLIADLRAKGIVE